MSHPIPGAGRATRGRSPVRRAADPRTTTAWRLRVRRVLKSVDSPCFVFSEAALAWQTAILERAFRGLPVTHWWSCKTLPFDPALRWWKAQGRSVEVVSEAEWVRVRRLGFSPDAILINGPAKLGWLARQAMPGMRVNFDSLTELEALLPLARRLGWRLGLRLNTAAEIHAEYPGVRTQFGLLGGEFARAVRRVRHARLRLEVLHFHLRTNVDQAAAYRDAMSEALERASSLGWCPRVLDLGGGLPAAQVTDRAGRNLDRDFSWADLRREVTAVLRLHRPRGLEEIWMETGRWLTAPIGVLVVRALDVKGDRGRGVRTVIADGGRTLHAMVATWEQHRLIPLRQKSGSTQRTLVCGPTCMAFDNLGIHQLPKALAPGDALIWMDAGAYQSSWETRFSHGLAAQVWVRGAQGELVRASES